MKKFKRVLLSYLGSCLLLLSPGTNLLAQVKYILDLTPDYYPQTSNSVLGNQLVQYWMRVLLTQGTGAKDVYSYNKAMAYFPHCSLTGFFPAQLTNEDYLKILQNAVDAWGSQPRTITLTQLKQNDYTTNLDSIKLTSNFLAFVTEQFVENAGLVNSDIKDPNKYHITLRDTLFSGTTKQKQAKVNEIHDFQNQYVAPYLHSSVTWSLTIFSDDGYPPPGNPPPSVKLTTIICSIPLGIEKE